MSKQSNTSLIIISFFSIYIIWGSTYLLNKIAVAELPPFQIAATRFVIAGILLLGIAKLLGKSIAMSAKQVKNVGIAGFLFLTLGNGLVVWALKYVDSGFAALVISAEPLVVLLLMRILQGKEIKTMSLIGVALGMVGIYLLVSQRELIAQEGMLLGVFTIFICMLSWGYGSLFVAKADLPSNYMVNTGYQMIMGGVLLLVGSLILQEPWIMPTDWSRKVQWVMVLLIVFGSIVAFTAFNYLLRAVSPEKVATSTYVNPIIALLLGAYFLDEKISTQSVIAAAILLTGVYFINTSKKLSFYNRFRK